jgi:hypothetical protein
VTRSLSAIAVGVVVPALVFGGCSGDPKPKFVPSESSSPTGASSSSAADSKPEATTARFINDYFDAVGTSTATGDTRAFVGMSSPRCRNCRTLAHNIEAAYENGGRVEGSNWEVANLRRTSASELGSVWNVDVRTTRERWYDGDDHLIKIIRASSQRFAVIVAGEGSTRVLRDMRLRS